MGVDPPIDVSTEQYQTILALLRQYLPKTSAWAYGSRAKWTSSPHSDLDLVVFAEPEQRHQVGELREAFEESNLPFRVDLFVWDDIPDSFRKNVREQHIELMPSREEISNSIGATQPRATAEEISKKITGWLFCSLFPAHWQQRSLYSMATWVNGLAFRNIQFSDTGLPVIKIAEIKRGISGQTKFTEQVFDESVLVRSGDLLFSWSGQPETSIDAFWWRGPEGWLNQHVFRVIPVAGVDNDFFYYLLRYLKPNFIGIARNKQTTGLGHVTKRDLENLRAAYPALPEQRTIAHILGTLDDKIELNQRMSETLESIARVIFKDWFVDFGPVRAKMEGREPYLPSEIWDLFPDVLDDKGKPLGWQTYTLSDLAHHHSTTASPSAEPERIFEHYSIPAYDAANEPSFDTGSSIKSNKTIVPEGAVLLSKLNPEIERVWLPNPKREVPQIASTEFLAFTPHQPATCSILYCLFRTSSFRREMVAMVTGTSKSHQRVQPKALLPCEVLVADPRLFDSFDQAACIFFDRLLSNRREKRILAQTRDMLLPKLMSGEIRLRESKKVVEALA